MSSLRHNRLVGKRRVATRPSNTSNTDGANSQRSVPSNHTSSTRTTTNQNREQSAKRGRKIRSRTQLRLPPHGRKVALVPSGDLQFKYDPYNPDDYKYSSQLRVILKREYPGSVKDLDDQGRVIREHPALHWADYYLQEDDQGETNADRMKREFWSLFSVREDLEDEANRVLENYADKRVNDIIYQLRIDSVKTYFAKIGQNLDDDVARPIELSEEEYIIGWVDWVNQEDWPLLAHHWATEQYLAKRKKAQESRAKSVDNAQNKGGSRPFTETQQWLNHKFGPEKATGVNTFAVMKSGAKNIDSSGSSGAVSSHKAQKIMEDYNIVVSSEQNENLGENGLDGKALYTIGGGLPHGRVPIGNGAVKKVDVISATKARNCRPSTTQSHRNLVRENAQLHRLLQIHQRLISVLYEKIGEEPPADEDLMPLTDDDLMSPAHVQRTGSSHVGSDQHRANDVDDIAYGDLDIEENIDCGNNFDSENNIASKRTMQHVVRQEGNSIGRIRANPSQA